MEFLLREPRDEVEGRLWEEVSTAHGIVLAHKGDSHILTDTEMELVHEWGYVIFFSFPFTQGVIFFSVSFTLVLKILATDCYMQLSPV